MKIEGKYNNLATDMNFRLGLNIVGANISITDDIEDPGKGLDIDFEIDKTIDDTINETKITIWNVSPNTYNSISKGTTLELYGAFRKDNLSLIFTGEVEKASQEASEVVKTSNMGFLKTDRGINTSGKNDIPTTIKCFDARRAYGETLIAKSYSGIVSAEVIIRDCVSLMNIPYGFIDVVEYPNIKDYVARGSCVSVLNDITKRCGVYYNITNGIFNLIRQKRKDEEYGIILTKDNSNRPVFVDETDGRKRWRIETKLLPFLMPGTYCLCDFGTLQGVYRIYRLTLKGNNYGTEGVTLVYVEESQ
jgi:hypothetical protein